MHAAKQDYFIMVNIILQFMFTSKLDIPFPGLLCVYRHMCGCVCVCVCDYERERGGRERDGNR